MTTIIKHPLTGESYSFNFGKSSQVFELSNDRTKVHCAYDKRQLKADARWHFKMKTSTDRELYFYTDALDHNTFHDVSMLYVALFEHHGIETKDKVFFFQQLGSLNNYISVVRYP